MSHSAGSINEAPVGASAPASQKNTDPIATTATTSNESSSTPCEASSIRDAADAPQEPNHESSSGALLGDEAPCDAEATDAAAGEDSRNTGHIAHKSSLQPKELYRRFGVEIKAHFDFPVFYAVPTPRLEWGEKEGHVEVVWGNLFFDLLYVAIFMRLSHMLSHGLDHELFAESFGLFVAMFIAMEGFWRRKVLFDVRFKTDDLFHRMFPIIAGMVAAVSTLAISNYEVMETGDSPEALMFSCTQLILYAIDFLTYAELAYKSDPVKHPNVIRFARFNLYRAFMDMLVITGSILTVSLGAPLYASAILWAIPPLLFRLIMFLAAELNYLNKDSDVPMHVSFSVDRYGEFVILAMGESIISIAVTDYTILDADYIVTYCLSYILIAWLCLIHFACVPSDPDRHVLRRSSHRIVPFLWFQSLYTMSLICVGTGFKAVLVRSVLSNEEKAIENALWLLSGALACTLYLVLFAFLLHGGIKEEYQDLDPPDQVLKALLWFGRLLLSGLVLVNPVFLAPAWAHMLYLVALMTALYIVILLDMRIFDDHREQIILREVRLRLKLLGRTDSYINGALREKQAHYQSAVAMGQAAQHHLRFGPIRKSQTGPSGESPDGDTPNVESPAPPNDPNDSPANIEGDPTAISTI